MTLHFDALSRPSKSSSQWDSFCSLKMFSHRTASEYMSKGSDHAFHLTSSWRMPICMLLSRRDAQLTQGNNRSLSLPLFLCLGYEWLISNGASVALLHAKNAPPWADCWASFSFSQIFTSRRVEIRLVSVVLVVLRLCNASLNDSISAVYFSKKIRGQTVTIFSTIKQVPVNNGSCDTMLLSSDATNWTDCWLTESSKRRCEERNLSSTVSPEGEDDGKEVFARSDRVSFQVDRGWL